MTEPRDKTELLVLGVHLDSEGYPNVRYRIRDFRKMPWLETTEINVPMWKAAARSRHSKHRFIPGLFRAVYAHLAVTVTYLLHGRSALVYVPYPSVFMGLVLGLLPRAIRPDRIVLDAFISLHDTAVNDRKLLSPGSRVAILLKRMEKKAYELADLVIVDTPQNASFLCREFSLPDAKVVSVPLSTDEQNFQRQPYLSNDDMCRVLFIGTFVPLHGVSAILAAANRLSDCRNILFRIVGTGQTATEIEGVVNKGAANLEWIYTWQTSAALADMIREADICLGIFGSGGKAQRVCPFKLYTYAACGKAIITGDTDWVRHIEKDLSYKPFETVPVNDGAALADRIRKLADSSDYRRQLAENSRRFYEEQLCNKIALSRLEALLCGL
ncbi:MAG TPA: glycosyltransferase [Gammaproteobacteria bacterium]|nr:glycosyltransferase [Gammaproteobacteria bacterium]